MIFSILPTPTYVMAETTDNQVDSNPNDAKEEKSSVPTEEEQISTPKKEENTAGVNEEEAIVETQAVSNPWKTSTSKYFQVNEENLAVYDNSTGSLVEVGQLTKGQVYPRISSYGSGWHKIQYGNIEGFVYALGTIPVDGSQLENENTSYSNQTKTFKTLEDVIVYDNTSDRLVPFGVINKGNSYPIVGDYGNWWRVLLSDRVGYVNKNSVKRNFSASNDYFRVIKNGTAVYDNRTGELVKVGELTKGQVYPRISAYGPNWHKIQFGNIYGYVYAPDTEVASSRDVKNENKSYSTQKRVFSTSQEIPVYDNSSGKLVEFGRIKKNVSFPIVSDYGNWWRVLFSNRIGYVHKETVKTSFLNSDKFFKPNKNNLPVYKKVNGSLVEAGYLIKNQEYIRERDYGNWHEINLGNEKGYVWKDGTMPSNGDSINNQYQEDSNGNVFELAVDAPVYDYSGKQRKEFATLKQNTQITSIRSYGSWYEVDVSGRKGYVYKGALKIPYDQFGKFFKVTADNTPVYFKENDELKMIGYLEKGQIYSRSRDYGNWQEINVGNQTGYVLKENTMLVNKPDQDLLTSYPNSDILIEVTRDATVYIKQGNDKVKYGTIKKGTYIDSASDYGNWYELNMLNTKAYIYKNNVRTGVSMEDVKEGLNKDQVNLLLGKKYQDYMKPTNLTGQKAIEVGDLILDNNIYVMSLWEPVKYDTLDWKMDPYQDDSWQLYFHSLRTVSYLLNAYEESGENKYLNKAKELTRDWIINNPNNDSSSNWAWADHPVSNRLLVMTYMIELLKDSENQDIEFMNLLLKSIKEHVNFQLSDETYRFPHNHGVMQDRSIIQTALTLSNVKESNYWLNIAFNRLEKQINAFVSDSGVHLEHSPFYHNYVIRLYGGIQDMISSTDYSLSKNTVQKLDDMKDYLVYITKPNLLLPYIGDTTQTRINDSYGNENLQYVVSKGAAGTKPTVKDKVYTDAGIAIFRDEWKSGSSYEDMTHFVFQAGYHSYVHKHADDLSFVLSSLGEDIFVDAGKYMYTDNIWRDYFVSSKSHNTITVDDVSYKIEDKDYGSFITDYRLKDTYSWIKGEHNLIDGVQYSREVLYIRPNALVIFDQLNSDSTHSYKQNFNLGASFSINKDNSNKNILYANSDNINLSIEQLTEIQNFTNYKGYYNPSDKVNPVRGYASTKTNELYEINQVEFEKFGKDVEFVTLITLDSPKYANKVQDIQIVNNGNTKEIKYEVNGKQNSITLPN
ncbi:heparinase II/III family protein [Aquibacillus sp. 3ASR75-11]|uniref:Heparinase II/III family protein n=1 Tax=Terrihalobacillus insolitus TaxID=2950438 RepID=A0A9X3WRH3_9BACI|nr:alginate lyase family protein [Terrihalobacillus insolitus]MDC3423508.1 heparinase II/III family protein [Terrihalobacillus insolitus]